MQELADGSVVSDTRYMKFAIGDSVTADEVYTLAQQATDQAPAGESEGAHSAALPIVRGPHPAGSLPFRWRSARGLWRCLPQRASYDAPQ